MLRSLGIFLLAFVSTVPFWNVYQAMADEAVLTYGCERILAGEWIYRDWDTHLSPGSFLLATAWFGLAGLSAPAPRVLFALVFGLTAVGIDLCARRCFRSGWSWLPSLLWCSCGAIEFPVLSYHWMASAAVVAALLALLGWIDSPGRGSALAVGVAIAGAGWILQSEGFACALMALFCWARFRPAGAAWVALGCVVASFILWLPVAREWPHIVHENWNLSGHLAYNRKPYSWSYWSFFVSDFHGLSPQVGFPAYVAATSYLFINALRYLGTPLIWLFVWLRSEFLQDRVGQLLAYVMLAWLLATANRHTIVYVAFLNPIWLLLLVKALQLLPRGYTLAACLSAWEILGWSCRSLQLHRTAIYPVLARRGVFYSLNPAEAASTNRVLSVLQRLPAGTDALAFPYAMQFYWLAAVHNPTRWMTQVPGLNSAESLAASRQMLVDRKVEWLVYFPTNPVAWASDYSVTAEQVQTEWEKLRRMLTEGYEQVGPRDGMVLYRRRPPQAERQAD